MARTQHELAAALLALEAQARKILSELSRVVYQPDVTKPTTPTGLAVTPVSETAADLSWNAATDVAGPPSELVSGVSVYRVYRNGVLRGATGALTFQDTGAAAYTLYSWTVSAVDGANNESLQSTAVQARTLDTTAPTAPVITATQTGQTSISVALTTPSSDGGSGVATYALEYKRTVDSTWTVNSSSLTAGQFPRPITGLTAGTQYDTRCRATDVSSNVGAYSATSQATTQSAGGFVLRTAANTGIAGAGISEGSLTNQGAITYNSSFNGQTITGKRFTGGVTITGSNITIDGCLFVPGPGGTAVTVNAGAGNKIRNSTIRPSSGSGFIGIYFPSSSTASNFTVELCDISGFENNISFYGIATALVDRSFLHDSSDVSDTSGHKDCVEVYGGTNLTFRDSTLIHPNTETSVVNVAPWVGLPVENLTIEGCFLDGGSSGTILVDLQSSPHIWNTRVRNNFFGGHTDGDWDVDFWNLANSDGRAIVTTEAALSSNPNAILWTGNTYLYTQNPQFPGYYVHATNRDGQTAVAGAG